MGTPAQVVPRYYVWQVAGKPVVVHLNLNVVDRLAADIMRGYGAVPKRGAEVGGVLLGTVEDGSPTVVKVEDFRAVPCAYRRGPSYLFAEEEGTAFEQACTQPGVVGYFRSHTRDGLSLAVEDVQLLDHFFSGAATVALLVKPFATKVNTASFFVPENGTFPTEPVLEFPFRQRELLGEDAPARRSMIERGPRRRERPRFNESLSSGRAPNYNDAATDNTANDYLADEYEGNERFDAAEQGYEYATPAKLKSSTWYWIPLSFIFLLLGVFLGFQIALSVGSHPTGTTAQDFSLNLSVSKSGENLNVKWNRQSAAVRAAQRGTLEIEDGGTTKPVDLDAAQIQNGSLIYRNSSNAVRFRLTVYPNGRVSVSVSESVEWK